MSLIVLYFLHSTSVLSFLHTPFAKSNGRFLSDTKIIMMPLSNLYDFGGCIKCMQVFIFVQNILTFCINPFCTGVLNAVSVIFFKASLNIIVNFIEWDLTDSDEILETLFLTHCLNLVQISWRLASLVQNHSRKSVGHCVRLSASDCMRK